MREWRGGILLPPLRLSVRLLGADGPDDQNFVAATERFAKDHGVPVISFQKGQRKDDVMKEQLRQFDQPERVVFLAKAQEKVPVWSWGTTPFDSDCASALRTPEPGQDAG